MLEIVDMAAEVEADIGMLAQNGVKTFLQVATLGFILVGVGVNRMVSYHDDPVFLGILQGFVEPGELSLCILLAGIRIDFHILAGRRPSVLPEDSLHGRDGIC